MNDVIFKQNYFTNCRTGLGPGSGWQTKAQSKGIDPETQRVLEKHVGWYEPPRNDPNNRPFSFKSFSLGSDLWCISLTQYVEKTWQGRYGSFFAHSLICSQSDFENIEGNPFHILRANCFTKEDPSDRTELDVLRVEPQEKALTNILDELLLVLPNKDHLSNLLDAFLFAEKLDRPMIIVFPQEKMLGLTEGLICLLPLSIRLATSFSTYECNPYPVKKREADPTIANRLAFINCSGTSSSIKSDFKFTDNEYNYGFFIFNFLEERFSEISQKSVYANWVSEKLFERKYSEIEECLCFMKPYRFKAEGIDAALALYQFNGAVQQRNDIKVNQAVNFARSQTDSIQIEKSIERLLSAVGKDEYDILIITAALEMAAPYSDKYWFHNIYEKYAILFKYAVEHNDLSSINTLMNTAVKLPVSYRIRLPIDLTFIKGNAQYFIPLMKDALDILAKNPNPDSEQSLYDAFRECLNAAINEEDHKMANALFALVRMLPYNKQLLLPIDIYTTQKYLKCQISMIGQVFEGLSAPFADPLMEQVYQKYLEIFTDAVRYKNLDNAIELMELSDKLPIIKRQEFNDACFDNLLSDLLVCLTDSSAKRLDFFKLWFSRALEDKFVFSLDEKFERDLDRKTISPELNKEFEDHGIHNPNFFIDRKDNSLKERIPQIGNWCITDNNHDKYFIKKDGHQLNVYHYDPVVYKRRLKEILQFITDKMFEKAHESMISPIILKEMASGKITPDASDLILLLFKFVDQGIRVQDRAAVYIQYFFPLVQNSTDPTIVKTFIKGAASLLEKQKIDGGFRNNIEQFLHITHSALDIVREIYPDDAERILWEWYFLLLKKRSIAVFEELINLYKNGQYALFFRLFQQNFSQYRKDYFSEIITLLRQLQPVRIEFYNQYLDKMLNVVFKTPGGQLPDKKFIEELFHYFKAIKFDISSALGLQYAKLMQVTTRFSKEENNYIDKWLASKPKEKDRDLEARIVIFREIQNLPYLTSLQKLLENHLQKFQSNKQALNDQDFCKAVLQIFRIFKQNSYGWISDNWNVIEEVALKKTERDMELSVQLIEDFLQDNRKHFNYLDILASATLSWIQDVQKFFWFKNLLTTCYTDLHKSRKEEYIKKVKNILKDVSNEEIKEKYPNFEDWEEMIQGRGFIRNIIDRFF